MGEAVLGDVAPVREPHYILELLDVADHLFERVGHVGAPAELGVDQGVDTPRDAAQSLLIDEIERRLKALVSDLAIRLAAAPGAPVVEVPVLRNDGDRLTAGLDHVGQVVVALITAPGVALLGQNPEGLLGMQAAWPHPADWLLPCRLADDTVALLDFGALLFWR